MFGAILSAVLIASSILGPSFSTLVGQLHPLPLDSVKADFQQTVNENGPRVIIADNDDTLIRRWIDGRMDSLLNPLTKHGEAGTTIAVVSARNVGSLRQKYGSIPGVEVYGEFGSMTDDGTNSLFGKPTFNQVLIPAQNIANDLNDIIRDSVVTMPVKQRHVNLNSLCYGYQGVENHPTQMNELVKKFTQLMERKYASHKILVEHIPDKQIINFRPPTADKGYFVKEMVPHYLNGKQGFILVAGDSQPDEPMFIRLHELQLPRSWSTIVHSDPRYNTNARNYVQTPEDIQHLLGYLLE